MASILAVQFITLFTLFFSMLGCCLVPMRLAANVRLSGKFQTATALANCFSAGVFLATFFVALLPEIRERFDEIWNRTNIRIHFPVTEFLVMIGFFIALLAEQLIKICSTKRGVQKGSHNSTPVKRGTDTPAMSPMGNGDGLPLVNHLPNNHKGSGDHHDLEGDIHTNVLHEHKHTEIEDSCGHHHHHDVAHFVSQDSGLRVGMLIMSLGVHSGFEGMALGLQTEMAELLNLFLGVAIHECLIAVAIGFNLAKLKITFCNKLKFAVCFSSVIFIGQLVGIVLGNHEDFSVRVVSAVLQGIAAGTFLHVTFFEIIPESLSSDAMKATKILFLFLGFVLISGITFLFHIHEPGHGHEHEHGHAHETTLRPGI